MLSKREREYLQNPKTFNSNYARRLKFSIRRKLSRLNEDLKLIAEKHPEMLQNLITSTDKIVTKFCNAKDAFTENLGNLCVEGRGWDSNPGIRLHRPEG